MARGRVAQRLPGIRFFLECPAGWRSMFGAAVPAAEGPTERRHWLLVDPMLRAVGAFPLEAGEAAIAALGQAMAHASCPTGRRC